MHVRGRTWTISRYTSIPSRPIRFLLCLFAMPPCASSTQSSAMCLLQIVSICFAGTTSEDHMTAVIGGDPDNIKCSSFGGSMRRFRDGINLVLPGCDRDQLYFGALLLVSADYPAAGQFTGTKESVSARSACSNSFLCINLPRASPRFFCRHCYVSQSNRMELVNFMKGDLPVQEPRAAHGGHFRRGCKEDTVCWSLEEG